MPTDSGRSSSPGKLICRHDAVRVTQGCNYGLTKIHHGLTHCHWVLRKDVKTMGVTYGWHTFPLQDGTLFVCLVHCTTVCLFCFARLTSCVLMFLCYVSLVPFLWPFIFLFIFLLGSYHSLHQSTSLSLSLSLARSFQ